MNRLILENNPKELARLSQWIDSFSQQHDIAEKVRFKMELATVEAATNIIDYAYDHKKRAFSVANAIVDNAIIVELEDTGRPFDPLVSPDVVLAESLDESKIGGLGIHLIRNYTDDCSYQRENCTNRLKITISL